MLKRALAVVVLGVLSAAPQASAQIVYKLTPTVPSKGIVVMIHGGGWLLVGAAAANSVRADAAHYQRDGYTVYAPTYPADNSNLSSLARDLSGIAARNPHRPVCLAGDSAGGHLALMLTIRHPDLVRCVISRAGISDPAGLSKVNPGLQQFACQLWCKQRGGLDAVSPLHLHRKLRPSDVLLTVADCDQVVGAEQSRILAKALAGSLFYHYACAPGPELVHATISAHDNDTENAREARFLARHLTTSRAG
jgi:pimeloyl-ACP methyl ester carboxylesterase